MYWPSTIRCMSGLVVNRSTGLSAVERLYTLQRFR